MAANKFATMFHTNTNKITLILVDAVLEWTLIILLLLNSVFSYFIINFAQFFGLHPPCFSCARVDRFHYHLCHRHSKEVSQLRLCANHKKLAEFGDMCENCTSSVLGIQKESRNFVFSKLERIDSIKGVGDDEEDFRCSCCRVNFEKRFDDDDHEVGEFQKADMNSQEIIDSVPQKTKESSKFPENLIDFGDEKLANDEETRNPIIKTKELQEDDSDCHTVHEEQEEVVSKEAKIPVLDSCDDFHSQLENEKNAGNFVSSVVSEICDSINTVAKLKMELKAEQKALLDLYMELEEERNASAVAASETMAMITRLQEEKAAMRMEALQYQRMMEEQSDYDQEALYLLNKLTMKMEKELESYKKKVFDYQAKESIRVLKRGTETETSSNSWSHSDDDEVSSSIDLYHVSEDEYSEDHSLESVLTEFEEERVSILAQLKFLEEKLVTLNDQEDQHYANVRVIEDHCEEINNLNCTTNVYLVNGKHIIGKQLLSLFDAINNGVEDDVIVRNGHENGFHPLKTEDTTVTRFELEKKRIDMEEEMDELYRRLQALEGDKEFLKHCIGTMKKGDKGMEVLQEILHLLRELNEINLRAKNYS